MAGFDRIAVHEDNTDRVSPDLPALYTSHACYIVDICGKRGMICKNQQQFIIYTGTAGINSPCSFKKLLFIPIDTHRFGSFISSYLFLTSSNLILAISQKPSSTINFPSTRESSAI